ncbi:ribonucleoside-diphosphate reductase subunit alpha [Sporosarcina psychrophila]|uniref:Ribonucleoside-diphosphate reductase n=1 Tax=Sporosarcina psychrophila TaxID=1476 RepID=A0ABV2KBP9_SPOPS
MTNITKDGGKRCLPYDPKRLEASLESAGASEIFVSLDRSITAQGEYKAEAITDGAIKGMLAEMDESNPQATFAAARIYLSRLYKKAAANRVYDADKKYGDYYGLQKTLASKGVFSGAILAKYSREEIEQASQLIEPERDLLFTYPGLQTLTSRYLATDHAKNPFELPQERWLTIALFLMQDDAEADRMKHVADAYWALSNLYMTVATPTLANAGKSHGQLSSCFIDTTDDSLRDIYGTNTDVAMLSKSGGGIGVYKGKVRAKGSSIRGYKGASSGVIPWIKQLNNTAVSVDQLGNRQGAIAIYLDVWHADILPFLDIKLNNGDERLRAHDIFTGVCLPDIFMEAVDKRGDWHLFDPHEVREVMGFSLEDYYDETRGAGSFRDKYEECVQSNDLTKTRVPAIDVMKRIMKSQLETGTPYMFYRDEVNRTNPNKHEGMIYSSNLCTEITQNMSPTQFISSKLEDDTIVTRSKPGDFVVCNLSSINLGRAVPAGVLPRLIAIQVRMLDNVIDLNTIEVPQAQRTNQRYRGIGLGTFGWHHLLALNGIEWETERAVEVADELYEEIAFLTIHASLALAKEKGAYPLFEGSDWQTGAYFEQRGYISEVGENLGAFNWADLMHNVAEHGLRNGYLMAVAPNASTSVIAGSTASIDPVFKPFYHEEKKDYKLPIAAPDLDHNTYNIYRRSAYVLDQRWSVRQNIARQRHIDQAISFNIYVPNTITAGVLLSLHLQAWKGGMKTTYYTRSTANEVEDCVWCSS